MWSEGQPTRNSCSVKPSWTRDVSGSWGEVDSALRSSSIRFLLASNSYSELLLRDPEVSEGVGGYPPCPDMLSN